MIVQFAGKFITHNIDLYINCWNGRYEVLSCYLQLYLFFKVWKSLKVCHRNVVFKCLKFQSTKDYHRKFEAVSCKILAYWYRAMSLITMERNRRWHVPVITRKTSPAYILHTCNRCSSVSSDRNVERAVTALELTSFVKLLMITTRYNWYVYQCWEPISLVGWGTILPN